MYDPNDFGQKMSIYDFVAEADSGIWIANPEETLYYKDLRSGKIRQIALVNTNGTILNDIPIECLYHGDNEKLWMFTHRGIFIMDVKSKKIEKHHYIKDMPYSANNLICCKWISNGDLYVGTMGGGINILSNDGTYKNIGTDQGFYPKTVFAIEEEKNSGSIWFGTNEGVYFYDNFIGKFIKADIFDSDKYGSFYPKSSFYTSRGEIIFGGTKGFFLFNPNNIRQNKLQPKVFFTDFLINNNEIKPGLNSVLKKDISVMNMEKSHNENIITLTHKQSHIRIHFSSNSYLNSSKNRFVYKLNSRGKTEEWQVLPAEQRFVQFSNLTPGTYTLEVKGTNNDGVWGNQISSLRFKIKPAPWFSIWAVILYIILIFSFITVVYRSYANKKIFQHRLKLEKMKEQKMNELIQLRIDFFTNISHDLKTPLTLILNPLNRLKSVISEDESAIKYVKLIERNVARIQRMISQLLQFREIESRKVTLNPQQGDMVKYVLDIFSLFIPYAEKKFISTSIESFKENLIVSFDYDTIEKILFNLISNAIKYSPEGESISLRIVEASEKDIQLLEQRYKQSRNAEYISIEITNTGIEIGDEQKSRLFKSFSRLSDKIPVFENSTGLGLSIVKELVEALKGSISLESGNKKVIFRVVIPFAKVQHTISQIKPFSYDYTVSELRNIDIEPENNGESAKDSKKANDIVVVEDNPDLRDYMKKELSEFYNVYIAPDGKEGIKLVYRINPQVVVTDLMMPKLDGFELSKILKSDIKTSHIPIIIISALGDNPKHKVQSLKDGADIFIEKPFDINFLKEQITNLIRSRQMLKEKYSKKFVAEPSRITFSSIDEELLKKAITFIEKNIDNPDYNVESFVTDMGGSRTLLYRKINEITGMSIKEFILDMRLKRSVQLLKDSQMTISEVAYQAGFNDAGYFSVCFKKHYGVSPSEFKKNE